MMDTCSGSIARLNSACRQNSVQSDWGQQASDAHVGGTCVGKVWALIKCSASGHLVRDADKDQFAVEEQLATVFAE